jgi:transposase
MTKSTEEVTVVIGKEDYMQIKAQHERGVYIKDIAKSLGGSPRTVSRALKEGGPPKGKRPAARGSILDPYKHAIDAELRAGIWNAQVITVKLRKLGYEGSYGMVKDYIRPKRPLNASRATVRYETVPGAQMQSDWGEMRAQVAGEETVVHFCVNVLGYSRRFHLYLAPCCDAHHTCEAQRRAFERFGGVPREILVDNQKVAVTEHEEGKRIIYNPTWRDFLAHYGAQPRACRPYRARTKGKVERMVGYVKGNFFAFCPQAESLAHYNQLAEDWLSEVADLRVHGTCGEAVGEMFARERDHLLPLPPLPFDTSYVEERVVAWDAMVEVRGNRYSVPADLIRERVQVRIGLDGVLRIFFRDMLVAMHLMRPLTCGWAVTPAHHEQLWSEALCVERRPLSAYEEVIT